MNATTRARPKSAGSRKNERLRPRLAGGAASPRNARSRRFAGKRRIEERKAAEAAVRKAAEPPRKLATRAREAARGAEVVEVAVATGARRCRRNWPPRGDRLSRSRRRNDASRWAATAICRRRRRRPPRGRVPKKSPAPLGSVATSPPPPPAARSDRSPLSPSNRRRPKKTPQKTSTATQMTVAPSCRAALHFLRKSAADGRRTVRAPDAAGVPAADARLAHSARRPCAAGACRRRRRRSGRARS